jgi:integrase
MDNIKFFLHDPNTEKTSIKLKFDYKGKRFVFGTGISINPKLWDTDSQRPTQSKKIIKEFLMDVPQLDTILKNNTTTLNNYESKIAEVENDAKKENKPFDFDLLKSELIVLRNGLKPNKTSKPKETPQAAPETPQAPYIKDLIHEYIKGMYSGKKKTKHKTNYDNETIKAYLSFKKMWNELESYFEKKYIFTDISMEFESELHDFFNDEKEYTPNTKGKMIKMLKCIIHDFIELEYETIYKAKKTGIETVLSEIDLLYIEKQLDRIIKPNSKPVNIALDENELQSIYELDLSNKPHLDRARDIFLAGCYTGLRFSDYNRIRPEHINKQYIQIIPIKTKDTVNIPLRPELSKILTKWNYNIPEMTSQELGRYIKEIGNMAGMNQNIEITEFLKNKKEITIKQKHKMITSHTARRSFATNMYYDGMNPIDIMKITGHKKLDTFQKYIVHDPNRELMRQEKNKVNSERYLKVV